MKAHFVRTGSTNCAYSAVVSVTIAAFGAPADCTQESFTSACRTISCYFTTWDAFPGRVPVMPPNAVQLASSKP